MKLRLWTVVTLFALTTLAAHAQIGLYFNPIGMRISNSVADKGPLSFLGDNKKSQMFYGVNIGGYYTFYKQGSMDVSVDVRDSYLSGNNAKINSFMVGPRVAFAPFSLPIKPFVQASIGMGTTRPPTNPSSVTRVQFAGFAGADYTLAKHLDWRVVEVGYSTLQTVSNQTIGFTATVPNARLISVSTGLVFRFH